jgi:hypothetical protein
MHHWLAALGAGLALIGTLFLAYDLWVSKDDDSREAEFRAGQDRIESLTRESVVGLSNALSRIAGLFAGYAKNLEVDLEPLFEPLLKDADDQMLALSVAARHEVPEQLSKAQSDLASSLNPERSLEGIHEIQRRAEALFAEQSARARRMRMVATFGVALVGVGAVAQLLEALLPS